MNQREAVYTAVSQVVSVEKGKPVQLDSKQKELVHELVTQMFLRGEVDLRDSDQKPRNEEYIRKYVPGLVNNWCRKDPNLNGGGKYEPKRPGSRTGSGDEALMAMKSLLAITKDSDARAAIEREMELRKVELAKSKSKPIDVSKLPESLRHLVQS
jgi:hypothetical protein